MNNRDIEKLYLELDEYEPTSDGEIFDLLKDHAKRLEISTEEYALNLHVQNIFKFDDINTLLGIELEE